MQGHRGVHARVVELDALADPVGPRTEDDHRRLLPRGDLGIGVGQLVAGVQVGRTRRELRRAGVDGLVRRPDAQRPPDAGDDVGAQAADGADLGVGQAVVLGVQQDLGGELGGLADLVDHLGDQQQLVDEPGVDLRRLEHLLRCGPRTQRPVDVVDPAVVRAGGAGQQLLDGRGDRAGDVELGLVVLHRAQCLAQRLGEVAPDRHHLTDRLHVGGEGVVGGGELLEREPRDLDHDVVQGGLEGGRGLGGDVVGDLVEGVADGDLGSDLGDREAGGLGGQRRRARDPGVHLDHDHPAVDRVDRELDVAAAGVDPDRANDRDADVAHLLVLTVGQRHRRGDGDRVAGVHPDRVEVLDRADHHHVVGVVTHHLELVLLPAHDRLLDQHLGGGAGVQAGAGDPVQVVLVVRETGAEAAHREGGADDHRVGQFRGGGHALVHGVADPGAGDLGLRAGHLEGLDDLLELLAVLAAQDRLDRGADQFDAVLLQHAVVVQRDGGVERGLAAQGRQQGVGALLGDDLLDELGGDRLQVGRVGELRVGHDRRRVGVHQDHPVALLAQHPARLGAGVVELTGLADDDRAGADDEDRFDVGAASHLRPPSGRRSGRTGSWRRAARRPPPGGTARRRPSAGRPRRAARVPPRRRR
ncbi:hypothetical protein SDC9_75249 [bioreactor metagenome]|uniref:NAD-specific glutamate dehydrogenase n=1 Tax=bioreactor metagenome TaxID=1076179 RepID=A0A644YLH1_9ZZZZ